MKGFKNMVKENIREQILGGCLQDFKKHLAGNYRGFYITLEVAPNGQYIAKINASSANDPNNGQLNSFLTQQKEFLKQIIQIQTYAHTCVLSIRIPNLAKNIPEVVNSAVCPVIDYLVNYNYISGCGECGNPNEPLNCYEINGGYHYLCNNCINSIHASLHANQQNIQARKSNLAAGLVGAFLGSLIGCAAWVLIYKLGYIAGIAGAITGICAMKGYEMLGGHLDKKGVIGSVIIMILMIFFANKIAWSWEAYDSLKIYGWSFTEIFRNLGSILSDSDLVGSYIGDLAVGYLLTALASYKNIMNAFRASGGSYTINKMN